MKSDKKNLAKNTISLVIIQILNYILPFITFPYLSRVLDVDKLGLVFFAQVFMDYFGRIIVFGFDFSGVRSIAINRDNPEKTNLIFNSIVCTQLLFSLISFMILSAVIIAIPKFRLDAIVYYLTFISVMFGNLTFGWFYQGVERMKFLTILFTITKVIALIFIFILVKNNNDYYLVPVCYLFGTFS